MAQTNPQTARQKISGEVRLGQDFLNTLGGKAPELRSFGKPFKESFSGGVSNAVNLLFALSLSLDASDVHVEAEEQGAKVRLRIDGVLQDAALLTLEEQRALVSRLKLLGGMKLNIADRPQDGRFSVEAETPVEVRLSSIPSEYGESLVLRILNPKSLIRLEDLGLRKDLLKLFRKEIAKPNGMIVVTGPTGSGKTTTLYAFLKEIHNPELKIITIEDPIEYHLEGISQTQVNPQKGYDFASGLRAIVRQDPDVILVGEIRDMETADIALQASLTGHLVFSTLHTNDAAGTITRLTSLGAKVVNIAPALNLAVAQRLVRKVCALCKKLQPAGKEELEVFEEELKTLPSELKKELKSGLKIPSPKECSACNSTGYKGRIGIFEAIAMDEELKDFTLSSPSISQLRKSALKKGMVTMRQDGLLKVLEGLTTMEEVMKATSE